MAGARRPGSSSAPSCSKRSSRTSTDRPISCATGVCRPRSSPAIRNFCAAGRHRAARRRASAVLRASMSAASPDGRWWVLGDRTQAPSGAGYALENRLALSRAMPDIYRAASRRARSRRSSRRCRPSCRRSSRRDDSPRLRADARAAERDLFRARLSRALSRLSAGRGRGPDRARRRRVHPHRVGLEARRSAAAPPRCRFRRSAGAERPLAARRARVWCRRSATATW